MASEEIAPDGGVTRPLSPQIIALGQMIQRLRAGHVTMDVFQEFLNGYAERLQVLESIEPEGLDRGGAGVPEAIGRHQLCIQEYVRGFNLVFEFTTDQDAAKLEEGYQAMTAADTFLTMLLEEIEKRNTEYRRRSEAAAVVTCPRCGRASPRGTTQCGQCRFMLPQMITMREETDIIGGSEANPGAVVEQLRGLAQELEMGGSSEPLQRTLDELRNGYLVAARRSVEAAGADPRILPEVRQLMDHTADLLLALASTVEQAQSLVQSHNLTALENALSQIESQLADLVPIHQQFGAMAEQFRRQG